MYLREPILIVIPRMIYGYGALIVGYHCRLLASCNVCVLCMYILCIYKQCSSIFSFIHINLNRNHCNINITCLIFPFTEICYLVIYFDSLVRIASASLLIHSSSSWDTTNTSQRIKNSKHFSFKRHRIILEPSHRRQHYYLLDSRVEWSLQSMYTTLTYNNRADDERAKI